MEHCCVASTLLEQTVDGPLNIEQTRVVIKTFDLAHPKRKTAHAALLTLVQSADSNAVLTRAEPQRCTRSVRFRAASSLPSSESSPTGRACRDEKGVVPDASERPSELPPYEPRR